LVIGELPDEDGRQFNQVRFEIDGIAFLIFQFRDHHIGRIDVVTGGRKRNGIAGVGEDAVVTARIRDIIFSLSVIDDGDRSQ